MKRVKNIWPQVTSFENLLTAHHKARRGKRTRCDVALFELDLESNIFALQTALRKKTFKPGPYKQFTIIDRKPRVISAAPYNDRVVHHALMNIVEPLWDRSFIDDCFACRPGKGVHRAVDRYQKWAKRYPYVLKLDVVKYFSSIDHAILKAILARRMGDGDALKLFYLIIDSSVPNHAATQPVKGVPIGNLSSQFFGNLYLDALDHFIKEVLKAPAYLRYVDDLILLSDNKQDLYEYRRVISSEMAKLALRLHPTKCQILRTADGVDVFGYRVWPNRRRLRAYNGHQFKRRLHGMARQYNRGKLSFGEISPRIASWIGHAKHGQTFKLREHIFNDVRFARGDTG